MSPGGPALGEWWLLLAPLRSETVEDHAVIFISIPSLVIRDWSCDPMGGGGLLWPSVNRLRDIFFLANLSTWSIPIWLCSPSNLSSSSLGSITRYQISPRWFSRQTPLLHMAFPQLLTVVQTTAVCPPDPISVRFNLGLPLFCLVHRLIHLGSGLPHSFYVATHYGHFDQWKFPLGLGSHACNSSTWAVRQENNLGFEASLGYIKRLCFKTWKKKGSSYGLIF